MGNNRIFKYFLLSAAVLFLAVGVSTLSRGFGWFFLGVSVCSFLAFGNALLKERAVASERASNQLKAADIEKPQTRLPKTPAQKPTGTSNPAEPPIASTKVPVEKPILHSKKQTAPVEKPVLHPKAPILQPKKVAQPAQPAAASTTYGKLFRRYLNQNESDAFAFFYYNREKGDAWDAPFERLAKIAKPENWNFQQPKYQKKHDNFPILLQYLNHTFLRLQSENKIRFESLQGEPYAFFNTGLQTPSNKDIFATFRPNRKAKNSNDFPDWFFRKWHDDYAKELANFMPLPQPANYFAKQSEKTFDASYDLVMNVKHVIRDNKARLPKELQENETLATTALKGAFETLKNQCQRNDAEAVPYWYAHDQKVQLLLPLYMTDPNQADAALVADKNEAGKVYRIKTILTLDMAYSNARLLRKPSQRWLNP